MEETREIEQASVPGDDLQGIKQRLQDWRAQRKPGERIPELLWAQAVAAARELGVYRVCKDLHLDYPGLKRRVEGSGARPPRKRMEPKFVELLSGTPAPAPAAPAATSVRHECVVELENARGAKMRVQLNGSGVAALASLCSAFWGA
jgi:hypothetical protein